MKLVKYATTQQSCIIRKFFLQRRIFDATDGQSYRPISILSSVANTIDARFLVAGIKNNK